MPQVMPDGFGVVTIKFEPIGGQGPRVITWAYDIDDQTSVEAELATIETNWILAFPVSMLSDDWRYLGASLIRQTTTALQSADQAAAIAGTRAVAAPSPAVSLGITKNTAQAGRAFRGRVYLPAGFLSEADVDEYGAIDSTWVSTVQDAADDWKANMASDNRFLRLLHNDAMIAPTAVSALVARPYVRTQRRRQRLS